jgi:hypothetical protein
MSNAPISAFPKGLVRLELDEWQSALRGITVAEGDDWVILQRNIVDYVIDGFMFVPKNKIIRMFQTTEDDFTYDVISASKEIKKIDIDNKSNAILTLKRIGEIYKFIGVYDTNDSTLSVGIFAQINAKFLTLETISTKAELEKKESIILSSMQAVEFDTDYLKSLNNYMASKNKV